MSRGDHDYLGYEPTLSGKPTSVWLDTTEDEPFPTLEQDLSVDVAVVGGGIVGILTAYLLKQAGKTVALLEGGRLCGGISGHTTAKVTLQHGLIYHYLMEKFDKFAARGYAQANQAGMDLIVELASKRTLPCSLERLPAFVFTADGLVEPLKMEVEAARSVGIPASYVTEMDAPFKIQGAVRFDQQAQYHPTRFLLPLAKEIPGECHHVFENSRVIQIEKGDRCQVHTATGKIDCQEVVVATHFPIFDEGLLYSKQYPKRSYAYGVITEPSVPEGMFYTFGEHLHSIRKFAMEGAEGGRDLTILVGETHKAGQGGNEIGCYQDLLEDATHYLNIKRVLYHWSTQDFYTMDRVPFIGRSPKSDNIYIATGFGAWGMTNGALSAIMLRDMITKGSSAWQELFSPKRIKAMASASSFASENLNVAAEFLGGMSATRASRGITSEAELKPGDGAILREKGSTCAVSMAQDGTVTRLEAHCPHKGCVCKWNWAEKTWDCPCHGSRFTSDGGAFQTPAYSNLKKATDESH